MRSGDSRADSGLGIEVALAEFAALRAQIAGHIRAQAAVAGLGLTALGVVAGFSVGNDGDQRLLLAVPLLVMVVVLLHTAETYRISVIGDYIREALWPYLQARVSEAEFDVPDVPSWEAGVGAERSQPSVFAKVVLVDFPVMGTFIVTGGAVLIGLCAGDVYKISDWEWILACLAIVFAIAAPLYVGGKIRAKSKAWYAQQERQRAGSDDP